MLALENPHCGVSGVPFMNNTTGAEPTALSIACLVSDDKYRKAVGEIRGYENLVANIGAGRAAWRKACVAPVSIGKEFLERSALTDDKVGLINILVDNVKVIHK
jgi:hypothetical protein